MEENEKRTEELFREIRGAVVEKYNNLLTREVKTSWNLRRINEDTFSYNEKYIYF
jgi:hypothetical protein